MEQVIARRAFVPGYMLLDTMFLLLFAGMLLWKRQFMTVLVGTIMGIVYMLVDYGIFHLVCHSRSITQGYSLFWVLLWMSMSYGFTNFAWIWLWLEKDRHLLEWSLLILCWWFCCPMLANTFFPEQELIVIQRTTSGYHGYMALILFIGYLGVILYNLSQTRREREVNIPWILSIGILVQLGWEAGLLLGGIRSAGFGTAAAFKTLIVNSLLETNLGMPYVYFLFAAITGRYTNTLHRRERPLKLTERIAENNAQRVK